MPKRFTDTEIWEEDWFLEMPPEYMLFFKFVKDRCDHAGIWKPNKRNFEMRTGKEINLEKALEFFNDEKERITVLKNGRWFLTGFIPFQYGTSLNLKNKVHQSINQLLIKNEVNMTSIRPLVEVKEGVKEKDKVKDKVKDITLIKKEITTKLVDTEEAAYASFPFCGDEFIKTWERWCLYRKEIGKKPYKEIGLKSTLTKLENISGQNETEAITIIEHAIAQGWHGFYEIKQNKNDGNIQNGHDRFLARP